MKALLYDDPEIDINTTDIVKRCNECPKHRISFSERKSLDGL